MKVKFNVLNHTKPDSLFNYGMQVLVYSEEEFKKSELGQHREGQDIAYYQNNFKKVLSIYLSMQESVGRSVYFYSLTFVHEFKYDNDVVFFAYCYPYTYTDLNDDLTAIEKDPIKSQYFVRNTLCRTLAGNKFEYITITAKGTPEVSQI